MSGSLDAVHHVLIGLFPESFHLRDDFFVSVQPENICIFVDESLIDELLHGSL